MTGATGFIGSALVVALSERYGPGAVTAIVDPGRAAREDRVLERIRDLGVTVIEADLMQLRDRGIPPPAFDVLYHLAAYAETENPSRRFLVNSIGTRDLLDWLGPRLTGTRVLFTGTLASVDRDRPTGPITESTPCHPRTDYGRTKLEGEHAVRTNAGRLGYTYTIARLCTIIGHGYRPGGMFAIFPRLLRQNSFATRLAWPGRASYLCVSDLVRMLVRLSELPQTADQTFVVSNGEDPTFDELLEKMASVLGCRRSRVALPRWIWDAISLVAWRLVSWTFVPYRFRIFCWRVCHLIHDGTYADASKLDRVLGLPRYCSILDGLREAYRSDPI